ncbi:hypothetical protein NQ317_003199 [Molorchus minor]|uniref:Uncharacterized protein n=1 Tax=Molorchus minor TaxID=1323400 RepID=A0ABQ9IVH6_9CUCU|nr:hypothetical protein NQ317_003199 [Molorchus minor]
MDVRSSSSLSPPVSAALSEQTSVQYENDVSGMNQVSLSAALTQQKLVNIANCNNVNVWQTDLNFILPGFTTLFDPGGIKCDSSVLIKIE